MKDHRETKSGAVEKQRQDTMDKHNYDIGFLIHKDLVNTVIEITRKDSPEASNKGVVVLY